ncbi:MAG: 3-hydroxyacyl-CoA dehydrogenase/enoyl-CoA hydratase family protein [Deltaproteobacteria bacterium]|jgi:enoyl-CoA hydratase/3-hydroxyacyl-CoA dehydrogenase|nr:3-hydroxyacyl-CoA dehydrogenase/enoyl-CoA hydratase family protein [Deltaproteobacteria bacterium]MBW2532996.1 3-hydroxyacyl-CoA dehydrogenase/enoyl-CoA hydratase family protein [Deltaproteobacteria bacterium]
MIIGVIGSGAIGPDLAYGFISALAKSGGGEVYLLDIKKEALDAGLARIQGYVKKGLSRGKLAPKVAKNIEAGLKATMDIKDLANCDYVLEAATEELGIKRQILKQLEDVVRPDCLIGFATSGIPRAEIAAEAKHPERCFVNHPFFPAWRSLPIEIVPSDDEALSKKMVDLMKQLGKVPIQTKDVVCFAADDIFCNYCAEAARIHEEGTATPAQVDQIVNDAIGGGGPFNVMDLTNANPLHIKCLTLMKKAPTGSDWFTPPAIFEKQGLTPWHDRKSPGDPSHDEALKKEVLDRILAVLLARTYFVAENDICAPGALNWMTRMALGFNKGLLEIAEDLGADAVHDIVTGYAKRFGGFEVPKLIQEKKLLDFYRHIVVDETSEIATVTICRPEAMNALSAEVMAELKQAFTELGKSDAVKGVVLTGFEGALAGADITELAVLKTKEDAIAVCRRGHDVLGIIEKLGKPVVAAINGPVLGGGAEISMACHARVVGPRLMMGQPEVDLGIIPGYGGTQRLPRLIGLERALDLLRTGRKVGAKEACAWGWAQGEPAADYMAAAKDLIAQHIAGKVKLTPVNPEPMAVPGELPPLDIGHHSVLIDTIIVDVVRRGLQKSLAEGLAIEAEGFARCRETVDFNIGMTNFIQNGPRVPAAFMHE